MNGKPGMDRIVARPFRLEEALAVLDVPVGIMRIGRVLDVAVADGVAEIDRKSRPAVLAIAFVLVVAHHDQRIETRRAQGLADVPHRRAGDVLPRHQMLRRHDMGELGIGLLQQVAVGDRPALLVAMADVLIGFQEARQRFIRCEQHGRMRGAEPQHDLGHRCCPSFDFRSAVVSSVRAVWSCLFSRRSRVRGEGGAAERVILPGWAAGEMRREGG